MLTEKSSELPSLTLKAVLGISKPSLNSWAPKCH